VEWWSGITKQTYVTTDDHRQTAHPTPPTSHTHAHGSRDLTHESRDLTDTAAQAGMVSPADRDRLDRLEAFEAWIISCDMVVFALKMDVNSTNVKRGFGAE